MSFNVYIKQTSHIKGEKESEYVFSSIEKKTKEGISQNDKS
jgi:hypothetical protein